jgi:chromosome partitioning protein
LSKVIAITNQKGGVGKTTTSINLAACLAIAEKRTLLLDLDPQANATSGMGIDKNKLDKSVYDLLLGDSVLESLLIDTGLRYLDLLPANIDLVAAELELVDRDDRESVLAKHLADKAPDYEFVIVDCPPSLGLLTLNALVAADEVLIPIQAEYYALEGLSQLLDTIKLVQERLNPRLQIGGILITMFDSRLNLARQVVEDARAHFPDKVFQTVINRNVRLGEAPSFGKPIILYDIGSTGAENYISLAEEVLTR